MSGADFTHDQELTARIRSRHEPANAKVRLYGGDRVRIEFTEAQRAITPGQAVVLYKGDAVVGGGWIEQIVEEKRV
jgi:tRNA-specific 2-thiouridylase